MPSYKATIDYLFRQLPMYQRVGPKAFKKDLTNIVALCRALGNPEQDFPSIHVAGTNGKGSVCHLLAAALQAEGYRVALYTSPHYVDFRERIRINGQFVSKRFVVDFVDRIKDLLPDLSPSFFEITVAMAFAYFAKEKVDIAVIETGLGGRLDSTNVLIPLLSVITNISLDHTAFLGNDRASIAGEKAGIIKPDRPVMIGSRHDETDAVFIEKARISNAPIYFAQDGYESIAVGSDRCHTHFQISKNGTPRFQHLAVNLGGWFQAQNVNTAYAALDVLARHWPVFDVSDEALMLGWQHLIAYTAYQGRWQWIDEKPPTLVDSAHNRAGLAGVIEALMHREASTLHFVIGFVKDKQIDDLLALFPTDARYYFCCPKVPRGLDADRLKEKAADFGLVGKAYSSVRRALFYARRKASDTDLVFVGGSTFVAAEVLYVLPNTSPATKAP